MYNINNSVVVVIDIFRATSSMCYGIDNGAIEIIPVSTIDECLKYKSNGHLLAAERNGEVVPGFNFGNSPFSYTREKVEGKRIVLTTTNGTHAIRLSKDAYKVVVGSFLNLDVLCGWLRGQDKSVLLLCAGWKDKFNLEDTLFAGAVVHQIKQHFDLLCDASIAAEDLYMMAKDNMREFLRKSSHSIRLEQLNIEEDIVFCLQQNKVSSIPVLDGEKLVKMPQ